MNLYEGTLTWETGAARILVWAASAADAADKVGELLNQIAPDKRTEMKLYNRSIARKGYGQGGVFIELTTLG